MRLSLSTPYRQDGIVNLARFSAKAGQLQNFYTTLHLARWKSKIQRVPVVGGYLATELGRREFPGIPVERVIGRATLPELLRVGSQRVFGQWRPNFTSDLMYQVKAQFDNSVAKQIGRTPPDALVGMYGASLESFRMLQRSGGLAVLNFVNSHPIEHNHYLLKFAGLKAPHHELIPDWVSRRVERELELANLILVLSEFVAAQLVSHGVAKEKIAVIPSGVDLSVFFPSKNKLDAERSLQCLYVGQISHRKGVRDLLEAARLCRDLPIDFRLIGPIVSSDVLTSIPSNVRYDGSVIPGSGAAEAMRQADIFVLPTLEDAFSRVIFESMATGLPVITTTNAGSSELIEDGCDGLIVQPGDPAGLAEALRRLVEQPELRIRLGAAARAKVQEAHSWEDYGRSVLAAIEAALQRRSDP